MRHTGAGIDHEPVSRDRDCLTGPFVYPRQAPQRRIIIDRIENARGLSGSTSQSGRTTSPLSFSCQGCEGYGVTPCLVQGHASFFDYYPHVERRVDIASFMALYSTWKSRNRLHESFQLDKAVENAVRWDCVDDEIARQLEPVFEGVRLSCFAPARVNRYRRCTKCLL